MESKIENSETSLALRVASYQTELSTDYAVKYEPQRSTWLWLNGQQSSIVNPLNGTLNKEYLIKMPNISSA